jgi:hypothetical protein
MTKSNPVDETRIAAPVDPAKPQPRANVKEARKLAKAQKGRTRRKGAVGSPNGTNLQVANRPNSRHASTCSVAGKVQRLRGRGLKGEGRRRPLASTPLGRPSLFNFDEEGGQREASLFALIFFLRKAATAYRAVASPALPRSSPPRTC